MTEVRYAFEKFLSGAEMTTHDWIFFSIPFVLIISLLLVAILIILLKGKGKDSKNSIPNSKESKSSGNFEIEHVYYGIQLPNIVLPAIPQNVTFANLMDLADLKKGEFAADFIVDNCIEPCKLELGKYEIIFKMFKNEGYAEKKITLRITEPVVIEIPDIPKFTYGDEIYILPQASPSGGKYLIDGTLSEDNTFNPNWGVGHFVLTYVYEDKNGFEFSEEKEIEVIALVEEDKETNEQLSAEEKRKKNLEEKLNMIKYNITENSGDEFINSNEFTEGEL